MNKQTFQEGLTFFKSFSLFFVQITCILKLILIDFINQLTE